MMSQLLNELYTDSPSLHSADFYHQCLAEIEREYVAPQVFSVIRQHQCVERMPHDFIARLRELSQKTLGQNFYIRVQQQPVFDALERNRIATIALKGIVFAERYFGDFAGRPTSDIDVLFTQDNLEKAINCLRSEGFQGPHDYNPLHFHCVMSKQIQPGNHVLNIELHWSLLHQNHALPRWDEFWKNATYYKHYRYIKELTVQDTFYSICLHGANHELNAFKYILDVAHLIYTKGTEVDFTCLLETCRRDKTLRRVKATLNIVYAEFPSLHQVKPLPYRDGTQRSWNQAVLTVPVLTPDSWRLRFRIVREWFWPMREVALWHLRHDGERTSEHVYWKFYRQRLLHFSRKLSLDETTKEKKLHV